jgi:D-arabinose 1-dehydrogenase-like Zn-dependent alcohol dehydrogenase
MRATIYHGAHDIRVENVPDPSISNPHDAIVRVTRAAICGSDLWFYRGVTVTLRRAITRAANSSPSWKLSAVAYETFAPAMR